MRVRSAVIDTVHGAVAGQTYSFQVLATDTYWGTNTASASITISSGGCNCIPNIPAGVKINVVTKNKDYEKTDLYSAIMDGNIGAWSNRMLTNSMHRLPRVGG
jgi:hypothetical protein